jgi:hypothetical protein
VNAPGENPDRVAAGHLIGLALGRGFTFTSVGEDGTLWGEREGPGWVDVVFLSAGGPATAVRTHTAPLARGEPLFPDRITGTALTVLTAAVGWPEI